ncbi:polyamine-modulated factor 1-like isoform X2 [Stegodyphus dumicola]|uniref:polyamine-modulated factor 1-like isoform X2 n=1 Tax=Stegodyphus dumicola TaxID=202533 RepID=UPI0015ABD222|nr:polyamine-modulated factor 1-like isoform X2 [Stegodyphus dumicola]
MYLVSRFSVFKRGYPELYEKSRGNLREFYKQFKSQLKSSVQIDLDNLCQQTNTGTLLCELDKLIKEKKTNINGHSWRPSGNPEEDIKDHVYQEKQNYEEQLKSYLQILKTEKEELETELSKNHEAILQLQKEHHELHDALGVTLKSVNDVGIQIEDVIHDIQETEN